MTVYTFNYQSLSIRYENKKTFGNVMRDLLEKGVKSVTLTPKGLEYTTGRISLFVGNIGFQRHFDEYPEGITATGQHSVEVNVAKMHDYLGSDPKPEPKKPKGFRRTWMTPEEYERQKALNPTLYTSMQ